ncbi:Retrovirus-related Pol polyprotein from transposon RE2 [Vitis vinifera]|uniref:Retrovirus-related Pol polyprotein from transposon RE2 n=1 Tax=Vitis vinifera TaxID=29760 RepID=A0A438KFQ9_VITVI|nr:Retrovirus-related Pol polyprotein from transposon RE2 [Vitis vinifera]
MGVKPLPSLREAFSEVRREERGRPWCDHCKKPGHSRETCWKIHGKPVDWKPRQPLEKEGRGNHVATDEQSPQPKASPFNKEQKEMLQKLLSPLLSVQSQTGSSSNQVIGSGTLAHKSNFLSAFTAGKKRKKPWIVDSGASDHMTGDATIFDTYSSCPNNLTVRIAYGSLSKVAGTGSVVLSRDLTLNSVLLVPNLDCNLLSISKLTKEKRCITNFSSTHCEFQDLDSGKTIGNAEECSGLYILKERHDPQEQPQMTVDDHTRLTWVFLMKEKFQTPCQTLLKSFSTTRLISTVPPKIFGCSVFVHINQQHRSKLDPRSLKCIFLGYSSNQKGYKCYSPITRKFYNSMDVTFLKPSLTIPKTIFRGRIQLRNINFGILSHSVSHPSPLKITFLQSHLINPSPLLTCGIRSTSKRKRRKEHFLNKPMRQNRVLIQANFQEEVYMDIPAGLETTSNFNKVCRLRKSLYGLKQSPRAWFERFTKVVKGYGFVQCQSDHTLFVKHFPEGKLAIIIVYVDDIILTGDHEEKIDLLKKLLTKEFEIKDLGNLKYFLGMEIARSKKGIAVSQRKYVLDLLNETGMLGCKPAETPMDTTVKLEESDGSAPVDKGRYQRLVGKLIYLSHTRPDIGFSVSVVSQFMNNPTEKHMTAVIRILRYLKMTPGKGLFFQRTTKKEIEIFSDADWAGSVTDRRSTSGYCSFVWGNLVTWRSKKQSVVARSSAETEFRAMTQGICEGIWLNRLLEELRVPLKHPMVLYCDNQAAISIAKNPVHHDRTKHVEIDRHFIKEKIEEGVFKVSYTPTNCQTANILTKALARVNFEDLTEKLGMINIYNAA